MVPFIRKEKFTIRFVDCCGPQCFSLIFLFPFMFFSSSPFFCTYHYRIFQDEGTFKCMLIETLFTAIIHNYLLYSRWLQKLFLTENRDNGLCLHTVRRNLLYLDMSERIKYITQKYSTFLTFSFPHTYLVFLFFFPF